MLAIISKYQEELNLVTTHEHKVADEYARVYAEKEARGRVIDSLHQEATMWMDRKDAITKRAPRHPYCTRSKSRTMGDQEEVQEQMRADMSALKEQMASMMDAMLGMRQLMEKNAAITAIVSSAAEADPTLPAIAHHPDVVGQERSILGNISNPHLGYNRVAYPYGLPLNYTPTVIRDDAGRVPPPILEGEPPRQSDKVHEDCWELAQGDIDSHSIFADLVFFGERIEVGLKRGKFDYVSSIGTNARRIGATGAKKKDGGTHVVTSMPAWIKLPQISHGTHQYVQHHPSFSARVRDSSNSAPVQTRVLAPIQKEPPQAPAPTPTRSASNTHFGAGSNATRNFPPRPTPGFTPIPMTYEDLLPSLIAYRMVVISSGRIYQPHFPKWYNPDATCTYHEKTPGHSTEQCLAFKHKVQSLIEAGWLTFQEDRPNVKTNPLANHGGGAVNVVESGRPRRSKPLKDVTTPIRLQRKMKRCRPPYFLVVGTRKFLFNASRDAAPHSPQYPSVVKPLLFPYQNSPTVPWRYALPSERKEEPTDISSLSARVTNITGLSGVTRSGRVNNGGRTSLVSTRGNRGKFGLGYKPMQVDIRKNVAERKSRDQGSQLGRQVEGAPPCHISRTFISAGLRCEGQVAAICEDDPRGEQF
ncbi:hypothetical protein GmHk_04G010789 [Glycine max]|nr:hypothetical protein GmHk_04G010789 [Glycine max]